MLVIAHHFINAPDPFWSKAKEISSVTPSGLTLHSVFPSKDGKTGTCVWEAQSVEDVQKFLDEQTQSLAKNVCYEVNESSAFGLPHAKQAATMN